MIANITQQVNLFAERKYIWSFHLNKLKHRQVTVAEMKAFTGVLNMAYQLYKSKKKKKKSEVVVRYICEKVEGLINFESGWLRDRGMP